MELKSNNIYNESVKLVLFYCDEYVPYVECILLYSMLYVSSILY